MQAYLDAEMDAFEKQYGTKALGRVGTFTRGKRFTARDYVMNGIPSIHYGEIYTSYGLVTSSTISSVRNDLSGSLRYADSGDLVIACTGENPEDLCKAVAWLGEGRVAVHDDCSIFHHSLAPIYAALVFRSSKFNDQKMLYVTNAKVSRISASNLAKIEVPVPPESTQSEFSSNMLAFADLRDQLLHEVPLRHAQYEHYRDALLDLPRKGA